MLVKFQLKITAIKETKNLDSLKVEELMGSLKTFKMNLKQRKDKLMALNAIQEELKSMNLDESDDDSDQLALLTKKFTKFMRKMGKQNNVVPKSSKGNEVSKPNYFLK